MVSKNKAKLIKSLAQKKQRYAGNMFVAEGGKIVNELLGVFEPVFVAHTQEWGGSVPAGVECVIVSKDELRQISLLETPQDVLAIFKMRECCDLPLNPDASLTLALDGVQDAGNLGTIIRIADWFGVENVICSVGTVDVYNPKTVQATMGALARVNVYYTDLPRYLSNLSSDVTVYTTELGGSDIYNTELAKKAVVVMGNEGNGVSDEVRQLCADKLLIPSFPQGRKTSESLNVGVATAIVVGEFRRREMF